MILANVVSKVLFIFVQSAHFTSPTINAKLNSLLLGTFQYKKNIQSRIELTNKFIGKIKYYE